MPAGGWNGTVGEFVLRYEDIRTARSPEKAIGEFFTSTYRAGAQRAGWSADLVDVDGATDRV